MKFAMIEYILANPAMLWKAFFFVFMASLKQNIIHTLTNMPVLYNVMHAKFNFSTKQKN